MAGAMREVIGAAAGLSAFAIESARDLIHYMVRRGQMAQEEAEQLIAVAEGAYIASTDRCPSPSPSRPCQASAPGINSKGSGCLGSGSSARVETPVVARAVTPPPAPVAAEPEPKVEAKPATKACGQGGAEGGSEVRAEGRSQDCSQGGRFSRQARTGREARCTSSSGCNAEGSGAREACLRGTGASEDGSETCGRTGRQGAREASRCTCKSCSKSASEARGESSSPGQACCSQEGRAAQKEVSAYRAPFTGRTRTDPPRLWWRLD